jgi:hypothetical protein
MQVMPRAAIQPDGFITHWKIDDSNLVACS